MSRRNLTRRSFVETVGAAIALASRGSAQAVETIPYEVAVQLPQLTDHGNKTRALPTLDWRWSGVCVVVREREDARFREVEASCSFSLRFQSRYAAMCTTGYDVHKSQFLRLEVTDAWAELSPAYDYHSNQSRWSHLDQGVETVPAAQIQERYQFAAEMDHFAEGFENEHPQTPGEEGLRDHQIMEAIYDSAAKGRVVSMKTD